MWGARARGAHHEDGQVEVVSCQQGRALRDPGARSQILPHKTVSVLGIDPIVEEALLPGFYVTHLLYHTPNVKIF